MQINLNIIEVQTKEMWMHFSTEMAPKDHQFASEWRQTVMEIARYSSDGPPKQAIKTGHQKSPPQVVPDMLQRRR